MHLRGLRKERTNMANKFDQLKNKKSSNFELLQKKLKESSASKKDYSDDRFWRAQQDKSGSAQAVIRFLDVPKNEDVPFVKLYSFGFKGPTGQWFIENSPTTIGEECPVCEANTELWNSGIEANKNIARDRKRRLSYISNIYVVSDPANPENEGKVFLFKYGQKIFEKIQGQLVPEFDGDDAVNVFDMWKGANFKLRIVKKDGYANYDNSMFEAPKPLFNDEDDERYEQVWNSQHSLQEFVADDQFKSYDELKARLDKVLGNSNAPAPTATAEAMSQKSEPENNKAEADDLDAQLQSMSENGDDSSDDDIDAFKKLVS